MTYCICCLKCCILSFALDIQDGAPGERQDPVAGGSKPKVKVKSIDLPIVTKNIRQLDGSVLNDFVEYEVRASLGPWLYCISYFRLSHGWIKLLIN